MATAESTIRQQTVCAHEICTCNATDGRFCSTFCREHFGHGEETCACGHRECAATTVTHDVEEGVRRTPAR